MPERENIAWIDGSSTGMYCYRYDGHDRVIKDQPMTNNQAEWMALYALIVDLPFSWVGKVFSDSMLVVNQFMGKYKINHPELVRIYNSCTEIIEIKNLHLTLIWKPREENRVGRRLEDELNVERKKRWTARRGLDPRFTRGPERFRRKARPWKQRAQPPYLAPRYRRRREDFNERKDTS